MLTQDNKVLYIIAGPPGSGKSFFAMRLAEEKQIKFIFEADMWMVDSKGDYCFDPSRLYFCHKKCQESTKDAMSLGHSVIVSNTSLTKKEASHYIKLAKHFGYEVEIHHMRGRFQNVHGVPEEKVQQMREKHQHYTIEDFK